MAIDREIFDAGSQPDAAPEPTHLPDDRSEEDRAVSHAIEGLQRQPSSPPPQREAPPPAQQQPQGEATQGGLLQALLDEREKRQNLTQQLERYRQHEQQSQKPPLNERLFTDPDGTIAEIRREIEEPLAQQITQLKVNHDFGLAQMRHGETFDKAWEAWYGRVGTGQDATTYFTVMNSSSPGEAMVQWYKRHLRDERIGDRDLDEYEKEVIQRYLSGGGGGSAPRAPNGQFAPRPQAPRFPTATSRMGAAGNGISVDDDDGDGTDAAIFAAGRPQRRK